MMRKIAFILLSVTVLLTGCSSSKNDEEKPINNMSSESETVHPENTEDENNSTTYVKNNVINEFINAYNMTAAYPFEDIKEGSRSYNAHAHSNGYYITFEDLSTSNIFRVIIEQTHDTTELGLGMPGMKEVFVDVVCTLDNSIGREDAESFFDEAMAQEYATLDAEMGNLQIDFYVDVELSRGKRLGDIEVREIK